MTYTGISRFRMANFRLTSYLKLTGLIILNTPKTKNIDERQKHCKTMYIMAAGSGINEMIFPSFSRTYFLFIIH